MFFTLISSLPIANTKRVTFSEEGCMSIELVRVLVWVLVCVLVWVTITYITDSNTLETHQISSILSHFAQVGLNGTSFVW